MNRTILIMGGIFSAPSLLLLDSAIKGTALLMLAVIAAIILRRDSAATRHLVWLLAIIALLAAPVLSALLPAWRVLPEWANIPSATTAAPISPSFLRPAFGAVPAADDAALDDVEFPSAPADQTVGALPDLQPALLASPISPEPAVSNWSWLNALPVVWAIGFSLLVLRLIAARWMLWNTERQATVLASARRSAQTTDDSIALALDAACLQLGIARPVTLLLHPEKTIPVVWGIFRYRLLLPAAARLWSGEQLRSVLLHELAHIKRHDTMAQLLTQIACALHWFNPLAWYAAWRLGVERERACDDLVLASGVRPSAYAGHLLDVVTELSPARWTNSCGLAMARKSSFEGRLAAVLSGGLNRRGVNRILAAAAMVLAAAVAIPLAMLRAMEPDKSQTEAVAETAAVKIEPNDAKSRPLFEDWKTSARTDGKIPGGRIGEMAASLKTFMELNPGHEQSVKLEPVLKKCDASRDWTLAEAAALLDEIAAITPRAEWAMRTNIERKIHRGKPLPAELKDAPWGSPEAQGAQLETSSVALRGLRIAWLLEPRAQTQALDSVMKSRVLFHNTGRRPVCFATEDWIQTGGHKAKDANGKDIKVWAIERMGIRTRMVFRLAPGEYAEVKGHGLGVGSHETSSEKSIYKVGCWIEAKEGDAVTFTPGGVPVSFQTWMNNEGRKDSATVWREMIAARVMQESPMPAAATDREQLLRRVMQDLLGAAPTAEEIAPFVGDNAKEPLARLIKSLQERAAALHFAGTLSGGQTEFRVTAAVAKEKPNTIAKLPGRLFVNAGLRTTKDEKHFFQSAIAIDPNTGNWTWLQNLSKSGFTVPLSPVRVSPDGGTMLYMVENEIWKCDAMTGANPIRVFQNAQPKAWAPDGAEFIAVVAMEAGSPNKTENWRVSADGKKQSVLPLPIGDVVEDWSPDGRWLLGWSHADGQLYIVKLDGSGRKRLTNTNKNASRNEHPRFSPDGRRIAYLQTLYQAGNAAPESRFSLRTINVDGTDDREILGEVPARPARPKATWTAPMGARWSPDGKHLAAVLFDHTRDGGILAINGNWRLAIIAAAGGNLRELKLDGILNTVLPWDGPEWRPTVPGRLPEGAAPGPQPAIAPSTSKIQPESAPPESKTRIAPKPGAQLKPATE